MSEQSVLQSSVVDFSENVRELNFLDFIKILGDFTKFGKEFVSKNYHAEKTDEKSISNTI